MKVWECIGKEKLKFILYFPSARDVQPLPGRQGFSRWSDCSRRQTLETTEVTHPVPPPFLSFHVLGSALWCGTSLWLIWVSSPGCVPWWGGMMWRGSADAVPAPPGRSQSTGVSPTPFQLPVQSTALRELLRENELQLSQTQYSYSAKHALLLREILAALGFLLLAASGCHTPVRTCTPMLLPASARRHLSVWHLLMMGLNRDCLARWSQHSSAPKILFAQPITANL